MQKLWPLIMACFGLMSVLKGTGDSIAQDPAEVLLRTIVEPALKENCFSCHSHSAAKIKGGLVLDSRAGLLAGGDSGAAIVVGKPEQSLLIRAIRHTHKDLQMPPPSKGEKLVEEQIAAIEQWIKQGAPWLGHGTAPAPAKGFSASDRQWWAIQRLANQAPPRSKLDSWCRNDIDRFIAEKFQAQGLKPSAEAPRETLIRRICWDVTGLPPSPGEVKDFLDDARTDAYEALADRLLASPAYGERWARQWLDLVRYAESDGYKSDDYRPEAWRFRDYVIEALNSDKPYSRFVQEQLAGDELWPEDPAARVATGFLRHWIYEYNNRDAIGQWTSILNDVTDTVGDVFLGLGMQCARCHDHKFDPILQKDYYRLQAFFTPLLPRDDLKAASAVEIKEYEQRQNEWRLATSSIREQIELIEAPHRAKTGKGAIEKLPEEVQAIVAKAAQNRTPYDQQIAELAGRQITYEHERIEARIKGEERKRWERLKDELAVFDGLKPAALPAVQAVTDIGLQAPPTYLPKGPRIPIEPGYLSLLDSSPAVIPPLPSRLPSTGRRAALARWITAPDNALTARVIVNRVWQQHFGRGLVATSSDFGRLGETPSHPELLDWLARRFIADGMRLKKLHRLILTSATYRQLAVVPGSEMTFQRDPENRLLWRMNSRRLEAEQIRDAILSATGELNRRAGGAAADFNVPRRTIYSKVLRNRHDPLLEVFDAPESFVSSAQRNVTTTPNQALLMMNHPFVMERAAKLARRVLGEASGDDRRAVTVAYQLTLGRAPSRSETLAAIKFVAAQLRSDSSDKRPAPGISGLPIVHETPPIEPAVPLGPNAAALGNGERPRDLAARASSDPNRRSTPKLDPGKPGGLLTAWTDFCHVLLNSSEFIYVD